MTQDDIVSLVAMNPLVRQSDVCRQLQNGYYQGGTAKQILSLVRWKIIGRVDNGAGKYLLYWTGETR